MKYLFQFSQHKTRLLIYQEKKVQPTPESNPKITSIQKEITQLENSIDPSLHNSSEERKKILDEIHQALEILATKHQPTDLKSTDYYEYKKSVEGEILELEWSAYIPPKIAQKYFEERAGSISFPLAKGSLTELKNQYQKILEQVPKKFHRQTKQRFEEHITRLKTKNPTHSQESIEAYAYPQHITELKIITKWNDKTISPNRNGEIVNALIFLKDSAEIFNEIESDPKATHNTETPAQKEYWRLRKKSEKIIEDFEGKLRE